MTNNFHPSGKPVKFSRILVLTILLSAMMLGGVFGQKEAEAAARIASVTGNWNNTATWGGSSVPGSADSVTVNAGITVTVPSGYAAQCTTIIFSTTTVNSAIVLADSTASLTASGAVTITSPGNTGSATNTIDVRAGNFSAASVALQGTTSGTRFSQILISTGTATITGNITSSGSASRITFSGAGTLFAGGTFLSGTAGTFTQFNGSTVNLYAAGAQSIPFVYTFSNLTISGSGSKTINNATINGVLSLEGTASVPGTTSPTYGAASTIQYKGTGAQTTGAEFPATFPQSGSSTGGIIIANTSGNAVTLGAARVVNAPVTILSGATLDASASNFNLTLGAGGNWNNSGTFVPRTSTVLFNGAAQSILGATTWYNLSVTGTAARIVTFGAGVRQTVTNALTLTGASGQVLSLVSSAPGTQWQLNAPSSKTVNYVTATDSDASSGSSITGTGITCNGSNNLNWLGGTGCANETAVGNGTPEPSSVTIGPGGSATMLDAFTLQATSGTDTVTGATVALAPAGAYANIALVEITSDNGATSYCSVSNPASDTVALTSCGISVTSSSVQYKVRITPKTHANMPAVPGASYATTGTVTVIACTNTKAYNDSTSATVTIDNASPANATAFSGTAGVSQIVLNWTNPVDADFSQVVVVRRTGSATDATQPTEGTTYIAGNSVGTGTVACIIDTPIATCTDSGLTDGTNYYYRIFAKDSRGNYSDAGATAGPYSPLVGTTVGNGASEPSNVDLGPGASATMLDAFTLQTTSGSDTVTGATVALAPAGAYANIALVEITSDDGVTVKCSVSNPASNTVALTSCGIAVTASSTQYKVRITPRTHANMPAVPGASYATTGTVTVITCTNAKSYSDSGSATVTIDNGSPANPTAFSGTIGNAHIDLIWTNPVDADFSQVVVIRRDGSATDATQPTEGLTYVAGNTIGTGTVACVIDSPTAACTDSGLANGTAYYYRIFAKDANGNYSSVGTTAGPYTPALPNCSTGVTAWQSRGSSNWATATNWECQVTGDSTWYQSSTTVPTTGLPIHILNGHTVTVAAIATTDNLTVDAGGVLTLTAVLTVNNGSGTDLTVNGTLNNNTASAHTVNGTISFGANSQYNHTVAGGTVPAATWASSSTANFTGATSAVPAGLSQAYGNLTWNCTSQSAELTLFSSGFSISGNLTVTSTGTNHIHLAASGQTTFTIGGDLILNGGIFEPNHGTMTISIGGNYSAATNQGLNRANLGTTWVLNFTGTGKTITGQLQASTTTAVTTGVTVASGASVALNNTVTIVTDNLIVNGTLDLGAFTANRSAGGGTLTLGSAGYLKIGGTGALPSNYTTHSINAASTVEYDGTNQTITVPNTTQPYGNLTLSGSGTKTLGGAITVAGNWDNQGVTLSASNIVTFSGSGKTIGGTASSAFAGITIGAGASYTMNNSNSCTALVFTASGAASSLTHGTGADLTVSGAVTLNQPTGSFVTAWNINDTTATVSGLITLAGTNATVTRIGKIAITTGTLNANGGITFANSGTAYATKVIDMSGGTGALNLKGALTGSGYATLTAGTAGSTFNYYDTALQTVGFFGAGAYNNLHLNNTNASGATLGAAITATNVTGNVRVQSGTFNNGGFAIAGSVADTFEVSDGATFILSGTTSAMPTGFGTKTFGATSTVNYAGTGSQAITAENYGNLTSSSTGGRTLASSGTVGVAGTFTPGSNSYTVTGSTVNFNGGSQNVAGWAYYNNLTLSGSGTKTLGGSIALNGNWTNNGVTLDSSSNSATVTFSGAGAQTITGANTWYGLNINNTAATANRTVYFPTGSDVQTVTNSLTLSGNSSYRLLLSSSTPSTQWYINAPATQSVSYVNPSDSNASGGSLITANHSTNVDNNVNWSFVSAPDAPSVLKQYKINGSTEITQGTGRTNQTQVVFKATATDFEGDQYKLEVEVVANSSSYSNSATCSSVLVNSGSVASTGACGSFSDGGYKWQYRLLDSGGAATAWTAFGGTDPDFTVDMAAPTFSSSSPSNTTTGIALNSSVTINWSKNVDCATVNTSNVTISGDGWALSTCSGSQAVFTTSGQDYARRYTVTIGTGVTDAAGNPMTDPASFWYETAALPSSPAGGGMIVYSPNFTTPQYRLYSELSGTFNTEAPTLAGAAQTFMVTKSAPTRNEKLVGYVTTGGVLYIYRWNGSTWTNETSGGGGWGGTVTVGGDGVNGRRFDIAYENTSGDAMVVYSTGALGSSGSAEMAYRTWNGTSWSSATNVVANSARFTQAAAVTWIKLVSRPGSDEIALTAQDTGTTTANSSILSSAIWNGTTTWTEVGSSHSAAMANTTGQLVQNDAFDMAYETTSGDLLVVWSVQASQQYYRTYSAAGTWGLATSMITGRAATQMVAASDPQSDQILVMYNRTGTVRAYGIIWSGAALGTETRLSTATTAVTPAVNKKQITAKWLVAGGTSYAVFVWDTSIAGTLGQIYYSGGTYGTESSYASGIGAAVNWMDTYSDPYNSDRLMLTASTGAATTGSLWSKRLVLTPSFSWSDADGGSAIETTLASATSQNFSFAYNVYTTDTTAPTVDSFAPASPQTTRDIALGTFTATGSATGYMVTTSATPPAVNDAGWTDSAPTTFTVGSDGTFTLYPWARDAAGNVSAAFGSPRSIIVDTVQPTLNSFTRQTPASSPTNADSLVFRAAFDEDVQNVSIGDFDVNGSTASVTGVSVVNASTYDVTVSGGNLAAYNGTVGLNLSASHDITDLAGNALPVAEPGTDQTYIVDNVAPTVTITAPAASAYVKGTEAISFTDNETTAPKCSIDNSTWVTCTSGVTTLADVTGFGGLGQGAFTLYLRDTDAAGNVGTNSRSLNKDTVAPGVTITNPAESVYVKGTETITFSVIEETNPMCSLGTSWNPCTSGVTTLSDLTDFADLPQGSFTLYVRDTDAAGNVGTNNRSLFKDTIGPVLTLSTLSSGAVTKKPVLNITGTADEASGISSIIITGGTVSQPVNPVVGAFNTAVLLSHGANVITVTATDVLSNQTVTTITITLATIAPTLTIATPADNSTTIAGTIDISGAVDLGSTIEVKVNNGEAETVTVNGTIFTQNVTLVLGMNTIEITATDANARKNSIKRTIVREATETGLTLQVIAPNEDNYGTLHNVVINGTVADYEGSPSVTIDFNGQEYTPTVTSGSFQQLISMPIATMYAVKVTATDTVHTSTVQRNLILSSVATLTSSLQTPQLSGVGNIVFYAGMANGVGPFEYQFYVNGPSTGNMSEMVQPYSAASTYTWTPTTGYHTISVYVRTVGSHALYEASMSKEFNILSNPLTSITLSADKDRLSEFATVGNITFTALASGGNNTPQYRFSVNGPTTGYVYEVAQDYSSSAQFIWTPTQSGRYSITVYARNEGSSAIYEVSKYLVFYLWVNTPITSVTLSAPVSKPSPQLITAGTITFTALASGGTNPPHYQFSVMGPSVGTGYEVMQPYSAESDFGWKPTQSGSYTILVSARNEGSVLSYEASAVKAFIILANDPVSSVTLSAPVNKPSPQLMTAGTITFTAQATGGTLPRYQFYVKGPSAESAYVLMQDYSANANFGWMPSQPGSYSIYVRARNANSPNTSFEASATRSFTILDYAPVSSVTLSVPANKASPQVLVSGLTITFTAQATGGTSPRYQFYVKGPSAGSAYVLMQDYSAETNFGWKPIASGSYYIYVRARNASSPGTSFEASAIKAFTILP